MDVLTTITMHFPHDTREILKQVAKIEGARGYQQLVREAAVKLAESKQKQYNLGPQI